MQELETMHSRAMDLAQNALAMRLRGDVDGALPNFRQAFQLERSVAEAIAAIPGREFDQGVLCCSAATLAIDCGQLDEAARLAELGLKSNPPERIANELREVLAQVRKS